MRWRTGAAKDLAALDAIDRRRTVRALDGPGPRFRLDGREVVSFASNDYLGLTQHPAVRAAAHAAIDELGTGAGSARLIVGGRVLHDELEQELADWKGAEAALLFPTGFAANLGVLTTFGTDGVTIISDERNHASIIDGCRLARADVVISAHGTLPAITSDPTIVVTDTVFSMDGDVADVAAIADRCAAHDALLVLDEAHAVLGPDVDPACETLRVGTLSKTLGSLGGFVAGPAPLIDVLRNRARSFIFTTASTPADSAAALAALRVLRSPEGDTLVARLRELVDRVLPHHPSPIIPVVLGSDERAVAASEALLERGLLVPAIRPPTVAPGTARLRITLTAAHTDDDVDRLLEALHAIA